MSTEARFLLAVTLMLGVLVVTNRFFPPVLPDPETVADSLADSSAVEVGGGVPTLPTTPATPAPEAPAAEPVVEVAPEELVTVESGIYRYTFSSYGGRLLSAELPQFENLNQQGVVDLIPEGVNGYLGQKLVVGSDTLDLSRLPFTAETSGDITLSDGSGPRELRYFYEHPTSDFRFDIAYTFLPDQYLVEVEGSVQGIGDALLVTDLGEGIAFAEADSAQEARLMAYVYNHPNDGIESTNLDGSEARIVSGPLLWAAFRSKFFVFAMLSGTSDAEEVAEGDYFGGLIIGETDQEDRVRIGTAQTVRNDGDFAYRMYMGPQEYATLSSLGQGMEEVNPYGWRIFRPIVRPFVAIIMSILVFLHTQLSLGYGWVLMIFGVLLRIVFFPAYHKAMKAQLRNMAVQPLVQEIQKKYKDNPDKLRKEMVRLNKEHGFNPLGGCLPMLLPWPVLIALFFVFQNTIELRGVPFLWLPDLSAKDPIFLLPILLAASIFGMQWISMRSMETVNPQMKMMMYIMPPMMLVIFANLPSGLNLYYATTNVASLPQQFWIANERKKQQGNPKPKLSED